MDQGNQQTQKTDQNQMPASEEVREAEPVLSELESHHIPPRLLLAGLTLLVLLLGGALYYYFVGSGSFVHKGQEITDVTVRLGWVHQGQFAGFYVAKELGFYEEVGLSVELLELDRSLTQVAEVDSGAVDFSVMEAHQLLVGVDSGADIAAVMAIYQINPHVLATRVDSGIEGPADFEGKVIGLSGGEGEGDAIFRVFVDQFEGNSEAVTYKNLGFETIDDFENKEADIIDIYRIDQPYLAEKRGVPLNIIALDAYGFSTYGDVLVTSKALIESSPEVIARFVGATQKGWEYALSNQNEAIAIVLPYTSGDYADRGYQEHIIRQSVPLVRGAQSDLGRMEFVSWSTLYETMLSAGALDGEFDVREIYTNEFIQ